MSDGGGQHGLATALLPEQKPSPVSAPEGAEATPAPMLVH